MLKTEVKNKTLVLGIGNTIASDDGIGIYVAEEVERALDGKSGIDIRYTASTGFDLMTLLEGYGEAVVVDAIMTAEGEPGRVYVEPLERLSATCHITSPHSVNLYTAVELGKRCGMEMPDKITVVAVEIADKVNAGEACTPHVEAAIPEAVGKVISILKKR